MQSFFSLIPIIFFTLLSVSVEAVAHFSFQSMNWGVVKEGNITRDRHYHIAFAVMWISIYCLMLLLSIDIWPAILLHLVFRRTVFSWVLNLLHGRDNAPGRKVHYLSENGSDGFFKRVFGERVFFVICLVLIVVAVILNFKFLNV